MNRETKHFYEFGPFRIDPHRQLLLRSGEPVPLTSKAFETLLVLVQHSEQLVSKDELMKQLWPDTFVEESNLTQHISMLRKALGESPQDRRYVVTMPGRGYRFAERVKETSEDSGDLVIEGHSVQQVTIEESENRQRSAAELPAAVQARHNHRAWIRAAAAFLALIPLGLGTYFHFRRAVPLTDKDTIVLPDFANNTGDPVFDDALKQALAIQLEQSPFLRLVSEARVEQTLRLMGQPADARLNQKIARELCQRAGGTAVLEGAIASLGSEYILGLKAVNCGTGDTLAQEQATATGKEAVLKALDGAAVKIRGKLGESLKTVEKYATPIEQATTPSLEALQAYSLGRATAFGKGDMAGSVPMFQRAIHFDPDFAMAYASLGVIYSNLGESDLASENTRKAYELRERVSEREKFYIESHYHDLVTGDLNKMLQIYSLWAQVYPRDSVPPINLNIVYVTLGQYEKSLAAIQQGLRLDPGSGLAYDALISSYLNLNRLDDAQATIQEMQEKNLDSPSLHLQIYLLAFMRNDVSGMAQQLSLTAGKPGLEDVLLGHEAKIAAYSGRLVKAREISRQAVASAERVNEKETAAAYEADSAIREALFGNARRGRERAAAALALSTGRDVQYGAALALALAGDSSNAEKLTEELAKRFPSDTVVQFNYVPTLRAQIALDRHYSGSSEDVGAADSIDALQAAAPYELGSASRGGFDPSFYPIYVRGEAYLARLQGNEAAATFQKVIDYRGVVQDGPIGALAHLELGRAYAMQAESVKARAAYNDFFTLWKDADPDIPILKEAKAEYAKLQ
jgi:DNA-binding winged helix-turn-helix (wHTH) protein/tetratricopeptide (TPR) repeat protein